MKLPLTREEIFRWEQELNRPHHNLPILETHKIVSQSLRAIELAEALEFVASHPKRFSFCRDDNSCTIYIGKEEKEYVGSTPLEAIQNAMKAEKDKSCK